MSRGITQLTQAFKTAYDLTYPDYKVYIKGFAFGKSSNFTGDYDDQGVRLGVTPQWTDVNNSTYIDNFYVSDLDGIEGVTLNWGKKYSTTGQPDIYADKQDNISLRLDIPHLLNNGYDTGGNPINKTFDFDELYVFIALYPSALTFANDWDSVNKQFPNEVVYFGFYVNILGTDLSNIFTYNGLSLNKYAFELNIGLLNIYDRMEMKRNEYLDYLGLPNYQDYLTQTTPVSPYYYFDNTDTPSITHAKLTFANPITYDIETHIEISDLSETISYTFRVSEVIDSTHIIVDGLNSDLLSISTGTWKESVGSVLLTSINMNINYFPLIPIVNNSYPYNDFSFRNIIFNDKRFVIEFPIDLGWVEGNQYQLTNQADTVTITIKLIKRFCEDCYFIEVKTVDLQSWNSTLLWKDTFTGTLVLGIRSYTDLKQLFYKLFGKVTEIQLHTLALDNVKTDKDFYDMYSKLRSYERTINLMVSLDEKNKDELLQYLETNKNEFFSNPYLLKESTMDSKTIYPNGTKDILHLKLTASSGTGYNSLFNIPVKAVVDFNIPVSSTSHYSSHIPLVIDGIHIDDSLLNDYFLFIGQDDSIENGLYYLNSYEIISNSINDAVCVSRGTGYQIGDQYSVTGGNGTGFSIEITGVDSGTITNFFILNGGKNYTVLPSGLSPNLTPLNGGIGTGGEIKALTVTQTLLYDIVFQRVTMTSPIKYGLSFYSTDGTVYINTRWILQTDMGSTTTFGVLPSIFVQNNSLINLYSTEDSTYHSCYMVTYTDSIKELFIETEFNGDPTTLQLINPIDSSIVTFTLKKKFIKIQAFGNPIISVGSNVRLIPNIGGSGCKMFLNSTLGAVQSVSVSTGAGGSGYTDNEIVQVYGNYGGKGCTLRLHVTTGSVTGATVLNGGYSYQNELVDVNGLPVYDTPIDWTLRYTDNTNLVLEPVNQSDYDNYLSSKTAYNLKFLTGATGNFTGFGFLQFQIYDPLANIITAPGLNYQVGETVDFISDTGLGGLNGTATVASINSSGGITSLDPVSVGFGYTNYDRVKLVGQTSGSNGARYIISADTGYGSTYVDNISESVYNTLVDASTPYQIIEATLYKLTISILNAMIVVPSQGFISQTIYIIKEEDFLPDGTPIGTSYSLRMQNSWTLAPNTYTFDIYLPVLTKQAWFNRYTVFNDGEFLFMNKYIDTKKRYLIDTSDMNTIYDVYNSPLYNISSSTSGDVDISIEGIELYLKLNGVRRNIDKFYLDIYRYENYQFIYVARIPITNLEIRTEWNKNYYYMITFDENSIYNTNIYMDNIYLKKQLKYRTQ